MEENIHLPQSTLNGIWKVSYSNVEGQSNHDADPDEQATIKFDEGLLSGDDPFGGKYVGIYSVKDGMFSARVEATSVTSDAKSILGIPFPYTLDFFGNYSSPNYFSILGKVVDMEKQVAVNCRRMSEDA